jgi:hypothetical protein
MRLRDDAETRCVGSPAASSRRATPETLSVFALHLDVVNETASSR